MQQGIQKQTLQACLSHPRDWTLEQLLYIDTWLEIIFKRDPNALVQIFNEYLQSKMMKSDLTIEQFIQFYRGKKYFRPGPRNIKCFKDAIQSQKRKQNIYTSLLPYILREKVQQMMKTFRENGMTIDDKVDSDGANVLMIASTLGKVKIVDKLIEMGANLNSKDNYGYTALMRAIINDNTDIINTLLNSERIDVDIQDKYGKTALMYAIEKKLRDIVKLLLKKERIDIDIQDKYGNTALIYAAEKSTKDIVELLLKKGY